MRFEIENQDLEFRVRGSISRGRMVSDELVCSSDSFLGVKETSKGVR